LTGDRCEKCELVSGYTYSYALERCVEICGDKMRLYAKCDDGNGISGDGCSS
jgi:cysteine-rich repeat protein